MSIAKEEEKCLSTGKENINCGTSIHNRPGIASPPKMLFRCKYFKFCIFIMVASLVVTCIVLCWRIKSGMLRRNDVKTDSSYATTIQRLLATVNTLKKSLNCITTGPNSSDINSMIGLSIMAGRLRHILRKWKIPFSQRGNAIKNILLDTLSRVETTRRKVFATIADTELAHLRLSDGIFQPDFWTFELPKKTRKSGLKCDRFFDDPNFTEFISETMSNKCLSEVSSPRLGQCHLTKECVDHMIRRHGFKGYSGTHKLFYAIAANRMGCTIKAPFLRRMITIGGSKMVQYACSLANLRFPDEHQDLFLEYVLFGSIAGYDEILRDEWLANLTEWQADDGCYRTNDVTPFEILEMVHKTAVVTGVLGSYIALYVSQLLLQLV